MCRGLTFRPDQPQSLQRVDDFIDTASLLHSHQGVVRLAVCQESEDHMQGVKLYGSIRWFVSYWIVSSLIVAGKVVACFFVMRLLVRSWFCYFVVWSVDGQLVVWNASVW